MTTFTYNSAGLSVKDRVTISNLLSLFASRLTAKWVLVTQPHNRPAHVVLVDVDQPEGLQTWEGPNSPAGRVAVTANEGWPSQPFVARPIRAYGHNGLIVLFNAIAQKLGSTSPASPSFGSSSASSISAASNTEASVSRAASVSRSAASRSAPPTPAATPAPAENRTALHPEPAAMRMTGRLDVAAAPLREMRPQWPLTLKPPVSRPAAPIPTNPPAPEPAPVWTRVAVRWGPPEPVILPALTRMPGARIHRFGEAAPEPEAPEIALPAVPAAAPVADPPPDEARPPKSWSAPAAAATLPTLTEMPVAHRPVEIHTPSAPVFGRSRIEGYSRIEARVPAVTPAPQISEEIPVLRPAPAHWKAPEPEVVPTLFDFRSGQNVPATMHVEPLPEVVQAGPEEVPLVSEPAASELALTPAVASPQEAPELPEHFSAIVPVDAAPADASSDFHPVTSPAASFDAWNDIGAWNQTDLAAGNDTENDLQIVKADAPEIQVLFADVPLSLQNLSGAVSSEVTASETISLETIAAEAPFDELPEFDAAADWWGASDADEENAASQPSEKGDSSTLLAALKAIKASAQPAILEIAGLPAVCVIPERNVYFTTAPPARLENAMSANAGVSWRACGSETEARQLSGTEQSRQASLEQLSWTASLMSPVVDPQGMADRAVRLRRWPPITESRGRSKFLRYATLLSGAQATPREIADITGDTLDEVVRFVDACSKMNLLETGGHPKARLALPAMRGEGAGILRDMIGQLTPPKL